MNSPTQLRLGSHCDLLLGLWRNPPVCVRFDSRSWELIVRVARSAKLLASLGNRLTRAGLQGAIPERVAFHIDSEATLARYRRQMILREIASLEKIAALCEFRVIMLKGAAYTMQNLHWAESRLPSDVDLLVPRRDLNAVENALKDAGWRMELVDPYDERYYRDWMHELPPLRFPNHPLEVDVHHTILPLTSRVRPNASSLIAAAVPLEGRNFWVLCPEDQVLHACAGLFQDSDLDNRLRDLVDIHELLSEFQSKAGFWDRLVQRAVLHDLTRCLWYALTYTQSWLGTQIPPQVLSELNKASPAPGGVTRRVMDALVSRALPPHPPDALPGFKIRAARTALLVRSHWLKMPPQLLARHLSVKAWRGFRAQVSSKKPRES